MMRLSNSDNMDAEAATKRASGVDEVTNKIEALPASQNDDQIRWETFYRIYTDDFLSRYAPGGEFGVLQELRDERHFPGMQPVGPYAIHIIVKNGRTMLLGIVDTAADRQVAEVRAREVTGVFEVENDLTVVRQRRKEERDDQARLQNASASIHAAERDHLRASRRRLCVRDRPCGSETVGHGWRAVHNMAWQPSRR
jgi:hypothetical protein